VAFFLLTFSFGQFLFPEEKLLKHSPSTYTSINLTENHIKPNHVFLQKRTATHLSCTFYLLLKIFYALQKKGNYKNINANFHIFIVNASPMTEVYGKKKRKRHFQSWLK